MAIKTFFVHPFKLILSVTVSKVILESIPWLRTFVFKRVFAFTYSKIRYN